MSFYDMDDTPYRFAEEKPLTMDDLVKAKTELEAAVWGTLAEIRGGPADIARLCDEFRKYFKPTNTAYVSLMQGVSLVADTPSNLDAGCFRFHFLGGKSPEVYKLW